MSVHRFETTHRLPMPREEAWRFFSDPRNLARITPPEMGFTITSDVPDEIYPGGGWGGWGGVGGGGGGRGRKGDGEGRRGKKRADVESELVQAETDGERQKQAETGRGR